MSKPTSLSPPASRTRSHLKHLFPAFLRPTALYRFFRDKRASRGSKILLVLGLAYVIWPIDLIPDAAPFIGWLDDIGMASAVLGWVALKVSSHERKREALEELGAGPLTSD
jgi:uncharacterized membrane protein YkvA (DUF1232 family)